MWYYVRNLTDVVPIRLYPPAGYSCCVMSILRPFDAATPPQQGHRGRVLMRAWIRRKRMVAIEFGM